MTSCICVFRSDQARRPTLSRTLSHDPLSSRRMRVFSPLPFSPFLPLISSFFASSSNHPLPCFFKSFCSGAWGFGSVPSCGSYSFFCMKDMMRHLEFGVVYLFLTAFFLSPRYVSFILQILFFLKSVAFFLCHFPHGAYWSPGEDLRTLGLRVAFLFSVCL